MSEYSTMNLPKTKGAPRKEGPWIPFPLLTCIKQVTCS
jgi:hypothetical protein